MNHNLRFCCIFNKRLCGVLLFVLLFTLTACTKVTSLATTALHSSGAQEAQDALETPEALEQFPLLALNYSPLIARNVSLANTTGTGIDITSADTTAITEAPHPRVIAWLLACSKKSFLDLPGYGQGDLVYRGGAVITGGKIESFGEYLWLARALAAYMKSRSFANTAEKARIDQWFYDNASFALDHMQSFLRKNFPNREADNFSTDLWVNSPSGPTYINSPEKGGDVRVIQGGDRMTTMSQWHNNRRTMAYTFLLLTGIAFADTRPEFSLRILNETKRYIKEWVIFSVYPTGETGEWNRNHEYPNAQGEFIEGQGITYNAYNSALALMAAHTLFLRFADRELLDFSTCNGLWGTECVAGEPNKTIWSASDLHIDLLTGNQTRINLMGKTLQVLYNYDPPETPVRNELRHASWYLPTYRALRANSTATARIESWISQLHTEGRHDDTFGLWRGLAGVSQDVRNENYAGIQPFGR